MSKRRAEWSPQPASSMRKAGSEIRRPWQVGQRPGRVYTRLELLEALRGTTYETFERSIDSHIKRLRQKIEPNPKTPRYILTVFGIGYKFAKGEEA